MSRFPGFPPNVCLFLAVCSGAEGSRGQHRLVTGAGQHILVLVQYSTARKVRRRSACRPFVASRHHTYALPASRHQTGSFCLHSGDDTSATIYLPRNTVHPLLPAVTSSMTLVLAVTKCTHRAYRFRCIGARCKCRQSIGGRPKK